MFKRIVDNRNPRSLASRLRARRLELFLGLLERLPDPVRILDVGGTEAFWRAAPLPPGRDLRVTLLNLDRAPQAVASFQRITGDCRLLPLKTGAFDVIFSNSVIEHVGGPQDQLRMADEVRRAGKKYFVQTPNRRFPVEPHFVFPLYQFLPAPVQVWLLRSFNLGWIRRAPDADAARRVITSIRLLDRADLHRLFPEAHIQDERVLGLTKSFMAHAGW